MPDVIVVGAGVVGAATAHALTEAGARVVVVEGGQVAAGTSAVTFAVDITRVKTPLALFDLSLASAREHAALQREWVNDSWLHPAGSLEWEGPAGDLQRVRDRVRRLHAWGYSAEWLSRQKMRDVEPALVLRGTQPRLCATRAGDGTSHPFSLERCLSARGSGAQRCT